MTYAADDLRSALAPRPARPAATTDDGIAAPEFLDFSLRAPDVVTSAGTEQWIVRGQNFVLIYSEPVPGDTLFRAALATEQVVLLVEDSSGVRTGVPGQDPAAELHERAMVVVPPGESEIIATGCGPVVQLIESSETEWAARAANAAGYAQPHPRVAPLEPWPEPVGGYRFRVYRVADHPPDPGRFGRLFRTRSFMVNFFDPREGPTGMEKLSPHFHEDFEQCSLVVRGTFVHHLQTPWGTDGTRWRPEDHVQVASPSVTIIPPPVVHTSQPIGRATNYLIDIFSGPREDFSAQPGWVINADEYPAPPGVAGENGEARP